MLDNYSHFGDRIRAGSGISELMQDLGAALENSEGLMHMLGGGNPANLPEVRSLWRELMRDMLDDDPGRFDRMLGNYDPQQGNSRFIRTLADLFNREFGWDLTPDNIAITNGGQTAFFTLFNLLGGTTTQGRKQRILFPLVPEYIGYAEQAFEEDVFVGRPSSIEKTDDQEFRYHIDFDSLEMDEDVAAVCVSRPSNPTTNVLSDDEVSRLHSLCRENGSTLIIDNAYGTPFPGIVFNDAKPYWGDNVILTYSLSKLGLPGTRTGIVIGPPDVIAAVANASAVMGLANGSIGQALTLPLFESGDIIRICRDVVRPFYESRCRRALDIIKREFEGTPCRVHTPQGALFLWLWFEDLPIPANRLYQQFKKQNVLVVPGHYFFHSLKEPWQHAHECIRINYSHNIDSFADAANAMAKVVRGL